MFVSEKRRRRRRWPWLVVLLALIGAGGAYAYFEYVKAPEDVFNPDVEFSAGDEPAEEAEERDRRVTWPTYGFTPQRTRYLPAERDLRPPFRRVWTLGGSKLIEFPPVVARGSLYFVKNNGEIYAVRARDGRVRWRRHAGHLAASSPAWSRGRIFVTLLERAPGAPGRAMALDARSGRVLWSRNLPSRTESSPLAMDGRVYFGSEDGTVYAVRARDGRDVWTHRAAGAVKAALAYSDGKLYFGDYAGQVTALDVSTGRKVWGATTEGRALGRAGNFYSTPAVAFGRVYVGNTDGRVYSFSARSGELGWSRSTGAFVYASPAVANVPGTKPAVYIGSYDGNFYALDARTGETIWTHRAGGRISGAATVVGRVVYFSNLAAKSTTALDVRNGRKLWGIRRGAFNPVVSDGERIYLTGYSSVYGFEPRRERGRRARE